jgi:DNA helicase II / ATP-dependent DNA helicase PcrA
MNPTEAQKDAIRHSDSNLHLLSCAGSGKTEVLARRVAIILTTGHRPSNVVAFSFKDKAAAEFKEGIISRCQEAIGEIYRVAEIYIGSIHAFCFELLTAEVPKYLQFDAFDEVLQALFIDRQTKKSNLTASTYTAGQPLKWYKDPHAT